MKANFSRTLLIVTIACVCSVATSVFTVKAYERLSEPKVAVPHTFSSGNTISSADVNENFQTLADAITDLEGKGLVFTTGPTATDYLAPDEESHAQDYCPSGYTAVACSCSAQNKGVYLTGFWVNTYTGGGGNYCRCIYHNTMASTQSITAEAQCVKLQ